jgi:hypothetical protein
MKKLVLTLAVALASSAAFAQEHAVKTMDAVKITKSDVPGPVVQQAQKDFPDASPFQFYSVGETAVSKDWKVSEDVDFKEGEEIDHYSVEMKGKNSSYEALYDAKGKLLMSKKVEKDVAIPQPILQALNKEYPGVGLKKDVHTKTTDHGKKKDYYVITLANGNKVTYAADGTPMKK